jgi:hypothetical protein
MRINLDLFKGSTYSLKSFTGEFILFAHEGNEDNANVRLKAVY